MAMLALNFYLMFFTRFLSSVDYDLTYRREYSFERPYHTFFGHGQFWHTLGSAMLLEDTVQLTSDSTSKKGSVWLMKPVEAVNWKVTINFAVHGESSLLYGDGFAFWYIRTPMTSGPVFGNHDYFEGLSVIFDTYNNYNDDHDHQHPYLSAHINDGMQHYDHDTDGTHSQTAGCTASLRGSDMYPELVITYLGSRNSLIVETWNGNGERTLKLCFKAEGVKLPTGYFFGLSAATGDLSDNHEISSFKFDDLDSSIGVAREFRETRKNLKPASLNAEKPRDHKYGLNTSYYTHMFGHVFKMILFFGSIIAIIVMLIYFHKKREQNSYKRLY